MKKIRNKKFKMENGQNICLRSDLYRRLETNR